MWYVEVCQKDFDDLLEKKTDISKYTYVGGSVQNLLFYGYINNLDLMGNIPGLAGKCLCI